MEGSDVSGSPFVKTVRRDRAGLLDGAGASPAGKVRK